MMRIGAFALVGIAFLVVLPSRAMGHEVRPGYLQITETAPNEFGILWKARMAGF